MSTPQRQSQAGSRPRSAHRSPSISRTSRKPIRRTRPTEGDGLERGRLGDLGVVASRRLVATRSRRPWSPARPRAARPTRARCRPCAGRRAPRRPRSRRPRARARAPRARGSSAFHRHPRGRLRSRDAAGSQPAAAASTRGRAAGATRPWSCPRASARRRAPPRTRRRARGGSRWPRRRSSRPSRTAAPCAARRVRAAVAKARRQERPGGVVPELRPRVALGVDEELEGGVA